MQGWVQGLEPGAPGRPGVSSTPQTERIRELEQQLAQKELALHEAQVRAEVALIVPQRSAHVLEKKGQRATAKLRRRKPR